MVGISRDSLKSHENFKAKYELPFPLISDADETVCNLYGVIKQKNMYGKQVRGIERSTFLIDAYGVLVQEWRGVKVPATPRSPASRQKYRLAVRARPVRRHSQPAHTGE